YARMVHGVLLARVAPAEVEDLVQEVFLHALRELPALRDATAFGGWLAAIARRWATDFVRGALSRGRTLALAPPPPGRRAIRDPARLDALTALAIIQSLPETYRETLVLRFVEGFTGPEIAAVTGLTEGSVRVNLHRGMALLRERLLAGGSRDEGAREARTE